METRWQCSNCAFYNDVSAERCVSCGRPKPGALDAQQASSVAFEPSAGSPHTLHVEPDEHRSSPPPQQRVSPPVVKSRDSRPAKRMLVLGVVVLAGVIAAVSGVASRHADTGPGDSAYLDVFWSVNSERNDVIDLSNSLYDEWMSTSADLPGPEFLVNVELADLQRNAELMVSPESDELLELHRQWLAALQNLVLAEELLAQEPSQTNLDSDFAAWQDEDAAYTGLYDYCSDQ